MKWLRWKTSASYTIEAVFIVPIVTGMVFVIFYVLFLLHDKVILQANLENLVFLLAEKGEVSESEYEEYLLTGVWLMRLENVTVKNKKMYVKGAVKGKVSMEIPIFGDLIGKEQVVEVSEKYYKIQPEEILRYGPDFIHDQGGNAYG